MTYVNSYSKLKTSVKFYFVIYLELSGRDRKLFWMWKFQKSYIVLNWRHKNFYLTFRLFTSLLFLVYIITPTIFCYNCYLLRLSNLLLQTAQHVSFPLSIHTNRYEYKSNRNTFTLTMNKKAVRRVCGLCYGKQSKIAMCQQVYFLLMVINICCNESEIMMADLQLCMSSPGNNFVQLSVGRGGGEGGRGCYIGLPRIGLRFEPYPLLFVKRWKSQRCSSALSSVLCWHVINLSTSFQHSVLFSADML
jgi:hypothetical protein